MPAIGLRASAPGGKAPSAQAEQPMPYPLTKKNDD
ncbi:hypothetical protein SEEN6417_14712 [Salmonella enterica subsp. enterica serovar Newport str. 637564_17]|nr:hypothetical protein SEEN6417_14712 [Salmonella enterica subsp. enterica serovar Newport str. 637564_17]